MTAESNALSEWWAELKSAAVDGSAAIDIAYQRFENAGLVSKVTVHQYRCRKCGPVATVIRVGGDIIARTRDNKLAPGTNPSRSVEPARRKNTLDGNRHWPGHTFNVGDLAESPDLGIDASCHHGLRTVRAVDIINIVRDVKPGHPGKPTLF